jgi:uncharacterized protein YneF (UPF0154 family)
MSATAIGLLVGLIVGCIIAVITGIIIGKKVVASKVKKQLDENPIVSPALIKSVYAQARRTPSQSDISRIMSKIEELK